jgi:hypothetical protein
MEVLDLKRKFSLITLGFMMVFAMFNLGVAQAEELPYKFTVSESLGNEKATVSLYNPDRMETLVRELEFTVVPDGATLSFTSGHDQWVNVSMWVEEDGVYKIGGPVKPVFVKTDGANKTGQVLEQYITFSYQPNSYYWMIISNGNSSREVFFKVQNGQSEPASKPQETVQESSTELVTKNIQIASKGGEIKLTQVTDKKDGFDPLFITKSTATLTLKSNQPVLGGMHLGNSTMAYYPDATYIGETLELGEPQEWIELTDTTFTLKPGAYVGEIVIVERIDDPDEGLGDYFATTEHFTIYVLPESDGEQAATATSGKQTAKPTSASVVVNGKQFAFEAYTINGNNFFKLRDLAMGVNGSEKQFEVSWDADKNAINLISASPYTPVGGEMVISAEPKSVTGFATTSKIYKDGKEIQFTAYNIGGNNYFKLRDIAQAFNIGVTWDGKTQTIAIDTAVDYIPE